MLVIVVTHGSRRGQFLEDLRGLADYIAARVPAEVTLAHNEYVGPDWREVLSRALRSGVRRVVFLLAFLGRGNHVARDIMGAVGVSEVGRWERAVWDGVEFEAYFTEPLAASPLVRAAALARVLRALGAPAGGGGYVEDPLEIEEGSMELIERALGLEGPAARLAARAAFAAGNLEVAKAVHVSGDVWGAAREAFSAGLPAVADVRMVAAGLRYRDVRTFLDRVKPAPGVTRAAAAMRMAFQELEAFVPVVGNAPTALLEVVRAVRAGREVPLVVAAPPGFTNAPAVKEELISLGIPAVVVRGTYGGSGVAAALFNELAASV